MKRLCGILILLLVFIVPCVLRAEEKILRFGWNPELNFRDNILLPENIDGFYNLIALGAEYVHSPVKSPFSSRLAKTLFLGADAFGSWFYLHEGGHDRAARANGAIDTSIKFDLTNGARYVYDWSMTEVDFVKVTVNGLDTVNHQATNVLTRNIGQEVPISEIVWFGINQSNATGYSSFIGEDFDLYSKSTKDPERWAFLISNGNSEKMSQLYQDLRFAGVWQGIGSLPAVYAGTKYLFGGKNVKMPSFWMNPQYTMTPVGVMYDLGLWWKPKDITYRVQFGLGEDRINGGSIHGEQIEVVGLKTSFTPKWSFDTRASWYQAPEDSWGLGATLNRDLGNFTFFGSFDNYSSGYNPLKIMSEEPEKQVVFGLKFVF